MCKVKAKYSIEQEKNLFSEVPDFFDVKKSVEVSFTAPDLSSFGGLALVSKAERSCRIIEAISRCIVDWRDPLLIQHSIKEMVSQRVMQIACGYEDADDCELWIKELKDDLHIDRMSCGKFSANQFRVFLHAAAYILLWHVRKVQLRGTVVDQWATRSLQLRILKSAVRVTSLKTKVKIEFGRDHPEKCLIQLALRRA